MLAPALALLLAGCVPGTGPDYEPPVTRLPDRYSLIAPRPAEAAAPWWQAFHDPVLDGLIAAAKTGNPDLAAARKRIDEAAAVARRDGVLLEGDTSLSVTRVLDNTGGDVAVASAGLGLDLFGQRARRAEAAAARLGAAGAGAEAAELLLLSEVTLAYLELRYYQEAVDLAQRALRSRRATLNDIRTLAERGAATRLDVLRAQALAAETEAELPRLAAQVTRQRNRLSTLIGRPAGLEGAAPGSGAQPLPRGERAAGVPADLLRLRPDVRQAERLYAAAVSDIAAAEAARWPSLTLSGRITAPLAGGALTPAVTAGLALPIFEQPQLAAEADAARARAGQAFHAWRGEVLEAVEEVESALAALAGSRQALEATREVVAYNEEALTLSRRMLDTAGEITVLDLLERERAVSDARRSLAVARRDYAADFVSLQVALGLGLRPGVAG